MNRLNLSFKLFIVSSIIFPACATAEAAKRVARCACVTDASGKKTLIAVKTQAVVSEILRKRYKRLTIKRLKALKRQRLLARRKGVVPKGLRRKISALKVQLQILKTCGSGPPIVPGCSDGLQNNDEAGRDCGGSCPSACPLSWIMGIDLEIDGTPGIDYAIEWAYHDRRVDDTKVIYIRDNVKIGFRQNDHNHDTRPPVRFKIDRDEQALGYYNDNDSGQGALTPLYASPFALSELNYPDTGQPVVGTVGNNGVVYGNSVGWRGTRRKYDSGRTNFGIADQTGDEWHVLSFWDSHTTGEWQLGDPDVDHVLLVMNPKTPLISFSTLDASAQYYTTPAKTYFIPRIFDQTTYLAGKVEIRLINIMGGPISYRINSGAVKNYSGPINSSTLSDGVNTIEYWYQENHHKLRRIIKNPDYPSKVEQHPHNFLWGQRQRPGNHPAADNQRLL